MQPPAPRPAASSGPAAVIRRSLRRVLWIAAVSAGAAVVLWAVWLGRSVWSGDVPWALALVPLALLLLPAAGTWLAVSTVRGVLDLPRFLRDATAEGRARVGELGGVAGQRGRQRAVGFVRLLWTLRGLALDARGRTVAALALFRVTRLSFVLLLSVAFLLNFVVIAAAGVAVLLAIL